MATVTPQGSSPSCSNNQENLLITANQTGSASDYAYSVTGSYDTQDFNQPSFNPTSGNLSGGSDGTPSQSMVYNYVITPANGPSGYAPNGNLVSYTDYVMGTWNFGYDTLNRLTIASTNSTNSPYSNYTWVYDSFGNRLNQYGSSQPLQANPNTTCSNQAVPSGVLSNVYTCPNGLNQIASTNARTIPATPSYDAAGDMQGDGENQYLYDGEGRVCAVAAPSISGGTSWTGYLYDADGNRVAKGTITQWSCNMATNGFTLTASYVLDQSGNQMTEQDGQGNWVHTNVYANGSLIATYNNQGLHFRLTDWLGTLRAQTSADGILEETCASLPFGDTSTPCVSATEQVFTGKERDTESGNDYFGARYYSNAMGRFMSPDFDDLDDGGPEPVPYADLENPQTLNLYEYAGNNPLIHIDADGHCWPQWLCDFVNEVKNEFVYHEWTTNTKQAQIHQLDQQRAQQRAASLWQEQHPGQLYPGSIQQDIVFPIGLEGLGGITLEEMPGRGTGTDPSTPIGRRGNPIDVTPGTNSPEVINGRKFTGHALDQMQGRGIPSSVVEDVITNGTPGPGNDPGTFTHTGDGVQVVTNSTGDVVTVKTVSR
ncbi:RHS repeat-associated core domain-containing protein [Paracidobacterium acidisoli]|uniref:RHS repeat-associated core domain-containing protein n=1 Tax=Paracidobacterium acidisoli TaxID=2303751 RepID=UPI001C0302D4|nr:DUF4258 domain-containing protein [Paracidobacterium acidisoli]